MTTGEERVDGSTWLTIKDGHIIAIYQCLGTEVLWRFELGQEIISNKYSLTCLPGRRGKIINILRPHVNGRTSDVIEVLFNHRNFSDYVKPEEIDHISS